MRNRDWGNDLFYHDPGEIKVSLASWRQHRAADLRGLDRDLLDVLLTATEFSDPEGRQAVTLASQGVHRAMVAVADLIGPQGGDLTCSWLLLAALAGADAASVQLGAILLDRANTARHRRQMRECRHLTRLAASHVMGLAAGMARQNENRTELYSRLADTGLPWLRQRSDAQPTEVASGQPKAHEAALGCVTKVVVVGEIPLHRGDRDDKSLVAAWEILTTPIKLAAGIDPRHLGIVLNEEFPWLAAAIEAIVDDLVLRRRLGLPWFRIRPTLLVGPPGSGKTAFAKRIAQLAGIGYGEVSAAGSADNRLLMGTARGWSTATPAYPLHVIRRTMMANPLILVDEVDKTTPDGRNGDIRQTLLGMLESTTAEQWLDECLTVPADLSAISWVLTANDVAALRGPLLTRLRVIEAPLPAARHADSLLIGIRRRIAGQYGLAETALPAIPGTFLEEIRSAVRKGISIRRISAAYERALLLTLERQDDGSPNIRWPPLNS